MRTVQCFDLSSSRCFRGREPALLGESLSKGQITRGGFNEVLLNETVSPCLARAKSNVDG